MSVSHASDLFAPVRQSIARRLLEHALPSMTVAVARGGEVLWEEGFGWADRERRLPADAHTPYALASISKPITATAVMVAAERGLLDLDRPMDDYLGGPTLTVHVGEAQEATVRRVASHSAGLPTHCEFFYEDEASPRPPMAETIRRYAHVVNPPGETYVYCNLGYGLLDHALSLVTGLPYEEVMRREVFMPLGLTRASVGLPEALAPYAARPYTRDGRPLPRYGFSHPGGSAVWCSAHDLLRFGLFHLGSALPDQREILSSAAREAMQTPIIRASETASYGLGWSIQEDHYGYRTVGHGGFMGGVSTHLRLVPSEGIAVVALVNTETAEHYAVVEEILAALLPEFARRRAESEAEKAARTVEPEPANTLAAPQEWAGRWVGSAWTHRGEMPLTLDLQPDGDVHVRLGEQWETLLNRPRLEGETLTGVFTGEIQTEDAAGLRDLRLALRRRGERLQGALGASRPHTPDGRMRNYLSHWVDLGRG